LLTRDKRIEQMLAGVGLPTTSFGERLAWLAEVPRQLHQALLIALLGAGTSSDLSSLLATFGAAPDVTASLEQLTAANLIAVDENGCITGVFPFSARPTRHIVQIEGGRTVYAMCAVDALAIPAILDCGVTLRSTDPLTGASITVKMNGGDLSWEPSSAVVVLGRAGHGPIAVACCAHIDFYADEASAGQALTSVNGIVLTVPAARDMGNAVFTDLGMRVGLGLSSETLGSLEQLRPDKA
jgi:hypothetical protein